MKILISGPGLCLFALLFSGAVSGGAVAGPTAELKVTGVIKPPACVPTFSGGGVVDFGTIPASSLSAGQYKILDTKQIGFQVSCNAPVKLALTYRDNRESSRVTGIVTMHSPNPAERFNFGLGAVDGKKVGGYALSLDMSKTTADGATFDHIYSSNVANGFAPASNGIDSSNTFSFAQPGQLQPLAIKTLNAVINVHAVINKPERLPLSQDVPLDGSTTIEVLYL